MYTTFALMFFDRWILSFIFSTIFDIKFEIMENLDNITKNSSNVIRK